MNALLIKTMMACDVWVMCVCVQDDRRRTVVSGRPQWSVTFAVGRSVAVRPGEEAERAASAHAQKRWVLCYVTFERKIKMWTSVIRFMLLDIKRFEGRFCLDLLTLVSVQHLFCSYFLINHHPRSLCCLYLSFASIKVFFLVKASFHLAILTLFCSKFWVHVS